MLPVQQLFAGGAMNPTAGMAMNPLLQGFGSYQNMQNDFMDRGLNQQSQDIQNQQQQHALDQSRLGDPLAEATRQRDMGTVGIDQSQIDSGQALATRQAQDQAKQAKAFADMSSDELVKHENGRVILDSVMRDINSNPDYDMNPENWRQDRKRLEAANFKNLPDVLDPATKAQLTQKAEDGQTTLKTLQAERVTRAAYEQQTKIEKMKAAAQVESSQNRIQTQRDLASAAADPDKKIILAADTEYQQSNGKMSAETAIQAKNVIRSQVLASEEGKNLDDEVKSYKNGLLLKPKELTEKAKAANLDPSETNAQKIVELGTLERNKRLDSIVNSKFKDRWPNVTIVNKQGSLNPRQVAPGSEPATNVQPSTKGLGTNKVSGVIGDGSAGTPPSTTPAAGPVAKPASAYQVGARVANSKGQPGTIGKNGEFVPD